MVVLLGRYPSYTPYIVGVCWEYDMSRGESEVVVTSKI